MRSPGLDAYFAMAANLGTHTFFMICLPILFWCGYTSLGRGMVHILAAGVFFSGFIKDMVCLPRPLSPPLQRITMSGSAALEYGFPSTHSTNAVSVAVYALHILHKSDFEPSWTLFAAKAIFYCYACSIVLGRLYCGMHGFFDVVFGSALGALIAAVQCAYGDAFDAYLHEPGTSKAPLIVVLIILVLVRIHPEPADNCPCFDDSVAFTGVTIGINIGCWHYEKSGHAWSHIGPATVPFDVQALGLPRTVMRILLGVIIIAAWREVAKPALLRFLPPLFRVIDRLGLIIPRKFFMNASQYQKVPKHLKDDNVIPGVSEIPAFLTSIRHPRRRAVSVGPQSEADAYETLAYREKRRRDSLNASYGDQSPAIVKAGEGGNSPIAATDNGGATSPLKTSRLSEYENMMGTGFDSIPSSAVDDKPVNDFDNAFGDRLPREQDEAEMFSRLERPRVRYDVEVVTKLIVYAGIGLLAVEWNPRLFELVHLGM
ncbi:MAG: hypothetical protein Q9227_005274 [Pyrenula ochraceoflavens]